MSSIYHMIYGNHIIVFSSDPFFADSYCNIPKTENPSNRSISILKRFPQKKTCLSDKKVLFLYNLCSSIQVYFRKWNDKLTKGTVKAGIICRIIDVFLYFHDETKGEPINIRDILLILPKYYWTKMLYKTGKNSFDLSRWIFLRSYILFVCLCLVQPRVGLVEFNRSTYQWLLWHGALYVMGWDQNYGEISSRKWKTRKVEKLIHKAQVGY